MEITNKVTVRVIFSDTNKHFPVVELRLCFYLYIWFSVCEICLRLLMSIKNQLKGCLDKWGRVGN